MSNSDPESTQQLTDDDKGVIAALKLLSVLVPSVPENRLFCNKGATKLTVQSPVSTKTRENSV